MRRANILSLLGQHGRAELDLAEAAALQPRDPLVARHQGAVLRSARRYKDALAAYDRSLAIEPHPRAYLGRCQVLIDAGRLPDAVGECTVAHGIDPSNESTQLLMRLYRRLGDQASAAALRGREQPAHSIKVPSSAPRK